MDVRWLSARRDALVDRVLGYALAPLLALGILLVGILPPAVLTGVGGLVAGALLADIKKAKIAPTTVRHF